VCIYDNVTAFSLSLFYLKKRKVHNNTTIVLFRLISYNTRLPLYLTVVSSHRIPSKSDYSGLQKKKIKQIKKVENDEIESIQRAQTSTNDGLNGAVSER